MAAADDAQRSAATAVAAADDPQRQGRLVRCALAIAMIFLSGGAVYGWPSMRQILRRDGALREGCGGALEDDAPCDAQEERFGMIFTAGAWANQGGRLLVGVALDRFGPARTAAACSLAFALGCVVFGATTHLAGLVVGFALIGVGGAGVQLAVQSVSALFEENRNLVMALLSGAFQAASGLFLVFDLAHDAAPAACSRRTLLLAHAGVAVLLAAAARALWPHEVYGLSRAPDKAAAADDGDDPDGGAAAPVACVPLKERSFASQARSAEFKLVVALFSINALQCQFTVGTIGLQLEAKGDADGAVTRLFSLVLALTFLATPFIGTAIDRLGFVPVFAAVNSLLLMVPSLLLLPRTAPLGAQLATCFVYAVGRVGQWLSYFAFVGSTFGFRHYGKLAGGGLMVQAMVSLLQYPLLALTLGAFDGDFTAVNALFVATTALAYGTIVALRRVLRASAEEEAAAAGTAEEAAAAAESKEEGVAGSPRDGEEDAAMIELAVVAECGAVQEAGLSEP